MNLQQLLFAAIVAAAVRSAGAVSIGHDKVQPFAQPEPVTVSEKAAIKFKPTLSISGTCRPYPAVNAAGETSAGLKPSGKADGHCKGSGLGSQVYGRAAWSNDFWAIMYAWYFPKDHGLRNDRRLPVRRRHKWTAAVVWLNNPALENPKILAVSTMGEDGVYAITKDGPCDTRSCDPPFAAYFNGTSAKLAFMRGSFESELSLSTSHNSGEFQDLIMWEQLTEEARNAVSQDGFSAPFNDREFTKNLEQARPSP